MTEERYSMSFTSGALLRRESLIATELYDKLGDWVVVREKVIAQNLLQMRTLKASQTIFKEVASRLKRLSTDQLDTF
jgi:hypothetical protein